MPCILAISHLLVSDKIQINDHVSAASQTEQLEDGLKQIKFTYSSTVYILFPVLPSNICH